MAAQLLLDEAGMPVPQYYDAKLDIFQKSTGEQGALNMNMQVFLKDLTTMIISSTDTTDVVADVTTFTTVGNAAYTTAQIYVQSTNNIIAASIVTSVMVNGVPTQMTLLRKSPISQTEGIKSLTLMLDPKVNAALPATWYLKVATEKDGAVTRVVNAAYQFIR